MDRRAHLAAVIADGPVDDPEGATTLSDQVDSLQARVADLKPRLMPRAKRRVSRSRRG
jgi:hypothetical protein